MTQKPSPKLLESLSELRAQGVPFAPVSTLKAWAGNPNRHEPGVPRLLRIIQRFGWTIPVVVRTEADGDGLHEISAGHGRLLAAAGELGLESIPAIFRNFSEHDSHAYGLADNKAPEFSADDPGALQAALDELMANDGEQDILDAGWTPEALEELTASLGGDRDPGDGGSEPPDEPPTPEPPKDPITKLGDVWVLGDHRLMCGDSTDSTVVSALMNGGKAQMVFTDPPYGMFLNTNYDAMFAADETHRTTGDRFDRVVGDHDDFTPSLIGSIFESFGYVAEIFLWGADYYSELIPGRRDGSWVAWDKRCSVEMDRVAGNGLELCWSKHKHKRMVARILWSGHHGMQKDDTRTRIHPTQKPTALVRWFFGHWGSDGDVVVDLFGGSGSTLIACEQVGRSCRMAELDPAYCDVIVERWEQMTGRKATREGGGV